jgi:subtilisin family serine protease
MSTLVVSQIEDSGGASLLGRTNAIINGNFGINQRAVSGTVTLAAGAYGHDRWKAGASGCTYTFATSGNVTTLTISAGSLIQVIEDINLFTGTYVLSWAGTAQGKIGAGSFGNSGITGSVTGGANLNIEFGTGTVSLVKFEAGTVATPFEHRSFGQELALCQRYYYRQGGLAFLQIGAFLWDGQVNCSFNYQLPVPMRAIPTFSKGGSYQSANGTPNIAGMTIDASASTTKAASLICAAGTGGVNGSSTYIRANNDSGAFFDFSAEL